MNNGVQLQRFPLRGGYIVLWYCGILRWTSARRPTRLVETTLLYPGDIDDDMDPLSIITGVGGLIQLSVELHSTLTDFINRHKEVSRYLRLVLAEITALKAIFRQLQEFIDAADTMDESRKSLVNTADLVTVLTGCVCIYSLLEKQIMSGHPHNDLRILDACERTSQSKSASFMEETNIRAYSFIERWKVARRWVDRTPLFVAVLDDLRAHKDNLNLLLTVMNWYVNRYLGRGAVMKIG